LQLALLQALHLDDVGARRILQCSNRGIEVAMLLLQARQLRPKLAFFLLRHRRLGRRLGRLSGIVVAGKWLWIIAFWLTPDKAACRPGMAESCTAGIFADPKLEYSRLASGGV
jgi:hypothetical protein